MDTKCIEWKGTKNMQGYGVVFLEGRRSTSAHRHLFMKHHKIELDRKTVVMHLCDNPGCVNIAHLKAGSYSDNSQDCITKGRRAKKHKPHSRMRKFSNETILAVKNAVGTHKEISKQFGVSQSYISDLRNNKAKKLINNP